MRIWILSNIYNNKDMVLRKKLTHSILVIALFLMVLPSINGCDNTSTPRRQITRNPSRTDESHYVVESEGKTVLQPYKEMADLGHKAAIRDLFDSYYFGRFTPKNKAEANRYLAQAVELGHEWALLVSAKWSEDNDPEKAINLFLQAARKDNRHAQTRLAEIYFEGKIIPQDICKSYFWALLAGVRAVERNSEHHVLCDTGYSYIAIEGKAERALDSDQVQLVQDAASRWQKGQSEPDLPLVQIAREKQPSLSQIIPLDNIELSKLESKEEPVKWTPVSVDLNVQLTEELKPQEIFTLVDPSVWTVVSSYTIENLKALNNVSLASGVAISKNMLLTNYHVVDKKPYILIKHGKQVAEAVIYAGDKQSDRCVLLAKGVELKPVKGFRKYHQLSVGDAAYSVGSPQGLENSLGQGIVSGKREYVGQMIIQTTAQISEGSSGGGLFDCSGNLIGVTSFKVIDGEGLNFAISIEDFTK